MSMKRLGEPPAVLEKAATGKGLDPLPVAAFA